MHQRKLKELRLAINYLHLVERLSHLPPLGILRVLVQPRLICLKVFFLAKSMIARILLILIKSELKCF